MTAQTYGVRTPPKLAWYLFKYLFHHYYPIILWFGHYYIIILPLFCYYLVMITTLLQQDYDMIINLFGNLVVLPLFRIDVLIWKLSHHYYVILSWFGHDFVLILLLLCNYLVMIMTFLRHDYELICLFYRSAIILHWCPD